MFSRLFSRINLKLVLGILKINNGGTGASTASEARNNLNIYSKDEINAMLSGKFTIIGNFNASGGGYPATGGSGAGGAILKGDAWRISVSGAIGQVGDIVLAITDNPGQTASNWTITEANLSESSFGAFINGLGEKTSIVAADLLNITDSADSNKQKKVTLTNFKTSLGLSGNIVGYLTSGTYSYTPTVGCKKLDIMIYGGGGGGGGGARCSSTESCSGGGGGGAAAKAFGSYDMDNITSPITVVVGAGGAGGAGATVDSSSGSNGSNGTGTSITSNSKIILRAGCGGFGQGGRVGLTSTGGGGGTDSLIAAAGDASGSTGGNYGPGGGAGGGAASSVPRSNFGSAGAGCGATGISTNGGGYDGVNCGGGSGGGLIIAAAAGQAGGNGGYNAMDFQGGGGAGSATNGVAGGVATSGTLASRGILNLCSNGSGGGGSGLTSGGAGGAGAQFGGGAGGGGSARNGGTAGAGGKGGDGAVIIVEYF